MGNIFVQNVAKCNMIVWLLCSILNESIPKDEADQLLQDLFHEMSKYESHFIVGNAYATTTVTFSIHLF